MEKLKLLLEKNNGTISAAEANGVGISNECLRQLAISDKMERVAHGIYISPDTFLDKMYVDQKCRAKIIFSHYTALFMHDLSDHYPYEYSVTVPTGYNTKPLLMDGFTVFSVKKEL